MKTKVLLAAFLIAGFGLSASAPAQNNAEKKISNIGLKLNLGLGSQDFTAAQDWERGNAAALSLGYGVSQRVSLWLGASASTHDRESDQELESSLASLELGVQYKLRPGKKLQPYGKLGLGAFFLNTAKTQTTLSGGGVTWGVGAEYRLVRFLSLGAEFFWKDFDYTQQRVGDNGEFYELARAMPGNSRGFLLNLTLQ
jgi:opacity protein-like surface antigen